MRDDDLGTFHGRPAPRHAGYRDARRHGNQPYYSGGDLYSDLDGYGQPDRYGEHGGYRGYPEPGGNGEFDYFGDVDDYRDEVYGDDGYDDGFGEFADDDEPADWDPPGPGGAPPAAGGGRRRRSPALTWIVVLVVFAVIGGAVWFGLREVLGIGGYADYQGSGGKDVLFEVHSGETTQQIADHLAEANIVASAEAFVVAGEGNDDVLGVQPGYYVMRTKMSGDAAVRQITAAASKVGTLAVRPGTRLRDVTQPDGSVTAGIYRKLSEASCAKLNGESTCVSAAKLKHVAETADLGKLGVPQWAITGVKKADPAHRLEGLIAPNVYQVRPGDSAQQLLRTVITESAEQWRADGLPAAASKASGSRLTPYQLLTIASLSESEAVKADFGKVARVTYNRLAAHHRLQYDSTINYVLDRPEIRTKAADRAKPGPYNTYLNTGLPPTPISSPSDAAVRAALDPPSGDWLYFVKCHKDGRSCFATTLAQHQQNVRKAQADGVY